MIYLVRMTDPGAKALYRDGRGFAAPMKEVRGDRFTPFENLPAGIGPVGGAGVEVITCEDEEEAEERMEDEAHRLESAAAATADHRARTEQKRLRQLGKHPEQLAKRRAAPAAADAASMADGLEGPRAELTGFNKARLLEIAHEAKVPDPEKLKKGPLVEAILAAAVAAGRLQPSARAAADGSGNCRWCEKPSPCPTAEACARELAEYDKALLEQAGAAGPADPSTTPAGEGSGEKLHLADTEGHR